MARDYNLVTTVITFTQSMIKSEINFSDQVLFNSLHPKIIMHILHTVLYTFPKVLDKENLSNKQELLWLVIISFILMTLICDSGVIL